MTVTINTDASFSRKYQRGTYAFWIVCNEFKITMSGILRKQCKRPETAEFRCIINALHILFTQKTDKKIDRIIINTDCLNVIHLMTDNKSAIHRYRLTWGKNLMERYGMILSKNKISRSWVELRHIESHKHTETTKHFVNQWCDDAAKAQIGKLITELESKKNIK